MKYSAAPQEIVALVAAIANEHHPETSGHDIAVVMQEKAGKRHGKVVLATCSLPTPRLRPLLTEDVSWVVCIAANTWTGLTEAQREACVDHELCHCCLSGKDEKPAIRGHDYEEFAEIVQRHGAWRCDRGESAVQQALGLAREPVRVSTIAPPALDTAPRATPPRHA